MSSCRTFLSPHTCGPLPLVPTFWQTFPLPESLAPRDYIGDYLGRCTYTRAAVAIPWLYLHLLGERSEPTYSFGRRDFSVYIVLTSSSQCACVRCMCAFLFRRVSYVYTVSFLYEYCCVRMDMSKEDSLRRRRERERERRGRESAQEIEDRLSRRGCVTKRGRGTARLQKPPRKERPD